MAQRSAKYVQQTHTKKTKTERERTESQEYLNGYAAGRAVGEAVGRDLGRIVASLFSKEKTEWDEHLFRSNTDTFTGMHKWWEESDSIVLSKFSADYESNLFASKIKIEDKNLSWLERTSWDEEECDNENQSFEFRCSLLEFQDICLNYSNWASRSIEILLKDSLKFGLSFFESCNWKILKFNPLLSANLI